MLEYHEVPPTRWTFEPRAVRAFVEENLDGRVLNLFAGRTKLRHDGRVVRNDLDTDRDADYHLDALELVTSQPEQTFDTVVLDPPYNVRKAREKYNGEYQGKLTAIKDQLVRVVRPGGRVLSFGYDTTGMSRSRRFYKKRVAVFCHNGDHNDTLCVVDERVDDSLSSWGEGE